MTRLDFTTLGAVALVIVALLGCKQTDPKAVCAHMRELAKKSGDYTDPELEQDHARCVGHLAKFEVEVGSAKFQKLAACVLEREDFEAAQRSCDPETFR